MTSLKHFPPSLSFKSPNISNRSRHSYHHLSICGNMAFVVLRGGFWFAFFPHGSFPAKSLFSRSSDLEVFSALSHFALARENSNGGRRVFKKCWTFTVAEPGKVSELKILSPRYCNGKPLHKICRINEKSLENFEEESVIFPPMWKVCRCRFPSLPESFPFEKTAKQLISRSLNSRHKFALSLSKSFSLCWKDSVDYGISPVTKCFLFLGFHCSHLSFVKK